MRSYNVKEVAGILDTNPETVRRWIRNGKLAATKGATKREGNTVSELQLQAFLRDFPKYAGVVASSVAKTTPAALLPLSVLGAAGAAAALYVVDRKKAIDESNIDATEIVSFLESEIAKKEDTIKQKKKRIEFFEKEIVAVEKEIVALENTIAGLPMKRN